MKRRCGKTSFLQGLHTGKGNFFKLNTYSLYFSSLILNKEHTVWGTWRDFKLIPSIPKKKKKKLLYNPHLHVFFNSKSSWLLFAYTVNLPAFSLTRTFTWRRKESHIHFLKTALGYLTRELSLGTTAYGDLHLRYICLTFHTLKTCITLMPI